MTTSTDVEQWLRKYGAAWEAQDPEAATNLFTDDGVYAWGPFTEPIRGRDAIRQAWDIATRGNQSGIQFGSEMLAMTDDGRGIARWWASMTATQTGTQMRMEGVFLITLEDDGRCSLFREWWNEDPPQTGASEFE